MEPRPLSHYSEGEYGALDLPDAWHVVSLAFFAASLALSALATALFFYILPD